MAARGEEWRGTRLRGQVRRGTDIVRGHVAGRSNYRGRRAVQSALGPTVARVVSTVMGYRWHEISELVPVNVTVAGASGIPASPGVPEYVVVEGKGAPPTAYLRR